MVFDPTHLGTRLADAARTHDIPGAAIAVLANGEVTEAAFGLLNTSTGIEATPDSLFQIGSISKVYTATLIMQFIEQGLLTLDTPVVEVLPKFSLADADVTADVTVRHLLCHTSGIDGDYFLDSGRGDDCIERYVESLASVGQTHALGATMSYCNAGYVVLGRIVEVLGGDVWDAVLRHNLLDPLGLRYTVTLPEEALRFRAAIGHRAEPGEAPLPVNTWGLMRSVGPAGLICARASDVVRFAQAHLTEGSIPGRDQRLLSAESVGLMQTPQVVVPDRWTLGDRWGLGWILFGWGGGVYGHDGSTLGQAAYLRIFPEASAAVALLTNGGRPGDLYQGLFGWLAEDLAGLSVPPRPSPPEQSPVIDLTELCGLYERTAARIEVEVRGATLHATVRTTGPLAELVPNPSQEYTLYLVDPAERLFVTRAEGAQTWTPAVFFATPDGQRYLHFGARATPKVS